MKSVPGKQPQREVAFPHVHGGVDLGHGLVVQGELVDLDPVADQLAHDLDLKLVQLALADGVSFGDDRDNVHLGQDGETGLCKKNMTGSSPSSHTHTHTHY